MQQAKLTCHGPGQGRFLARSKFSKPKHLINYIDFIIINLWKKFFLVSIFFKVFFGGTFIPVLKTSCVDSVYYTHVCYILYWKKKTCIIKHVSHVKHAYTENNQTQHIHFFIFALLALFKLQVNSALVFDCVHVDMLYQDLLWYQI